MTEEAVTAAALVALYCRENPERPEVRRFLDAMAALREASQ